jgi:hypothetical protein
MLCLSLDWRENGQKNQKSENRKIQKKRNNLKLFSKIFKNGKMSFSPGLGRPREEPLVPGCSKINPPSDVNDHT